MRKILFAAAVIYTFSFTSCTKENAVQPMSLKAKFLADEANKQDLGKTAGSKQDLGQADVSVGS